ncbi:MAG: tRNA uridine-5-carboxymethylaminomethyl(34) synthesis GTPase MnmE [Treponema sp.]|nr:tRNA uridine-5-carboxymethylaminomethyl(34) synthesis GTPase MnmE [Treponema sp.]
MIEQSRVDQPLVGASYGDACPIAAFASVPGRSALTLIRCSGAGTLELAAGVFSAREKLLQAQGNTVLHGWIVAPDSLEGNPKGDKIDEVLVSVFRAPKSYTSEDSLDISCHGGTATGNGVMAALRAAGFRDALPGEFTFRAFMNGKLDLTRCESVMELVSAKTEMGRRNAVSRLSGLLESEINAIKKKLVEVLAGAEIFLDYSEDEIGIDAEEDAGRLPGRRLAEEALARLHRLIESWKRERIYQEGILAVIAGRPNAGKSSLFNLLLREDRSIVTEVPGTTRDWIEAWVSIEGIPVRLVDTAGLRDSQDPVEAIGVERSRTLLENAELVLYLINGTEGITGEDLAFIDEITDRQNSRPLPCIPIWNKTDIAPMPPPQQSAVTNLLGISTKTGTGVSELTASIATAIGGATEPAQAAIGTVRQKNLVEAAAASLEDALSLAEREEPLDLIAPLLREAVNLLGEITGEVSTADILEEMFGKFCVGK